MPFAILKGETTMDELVARLFPSQAKISKAAIKQAAAILLKANPQLKDLSSAAAGSVIVIPDTAPPVAPAQQVAAPEAAPGVAIDRARQVMNTVASRLAAIDDRAREAAQALLELAQSKDVRAEAENFPDVGDILPSRVKAAQTRIKDLDAGRTTRDEAFSALHDYLVSLGADPSGKG